MNNTSYILEHFVKCAENLIKCLFIFGAHVIIQENIDTGVESLERICNRPGRHAHVDVFPKYTQLWSNNK